MFAFKEEEIVKFDSTDSTALFCFLELFTHVYCKHFDHVQLYKYQSINQLIFFLQYQTPVTFKAM